MTDILSKDLDIICWDSPHHHCPLEAVCKTLAIPAIIVYDLKMLRHHLQSVLQTPDAILIHDSSVIRKPGPIDWFMDAGTPVSTMADSPFIQLRNALDNELGGFIDVPVIVVGAYPTTIEFFKEAGAAAVIRSTGRSYVEPVAWALMKLKGATSLNCTRPETYKWPEFKI